MRIISPIRRLAFAILLLFLAGQTQAQTIAQQLDAIIARGGISNNTWTLLVENEAGTARYYQKNPTTGLAPASNTKIITTATAFGLLGTNHSFPTRIYTNAPIVGGVLASNLNLVCEHDPTWNQTVYGSGNARKGLNAIATKLKSLGLNSISGNVQFYGACMYDHGSTEDTRDTANQDDYNYEAATNLVLALQAAGITVGGVGVGKTGFTAPGGLFYTHQSSNVTASSTYGSRPLTLGAACIPLMKVSHNPMADLLLRHIGYTNGTGDSFSAGRVRVVSWMQSTVGVSTAGITMNDGSGYSSGNRFSAEQIQAVTRYAVNHFSSWDDTLPISCTDGTIGGRLCGTDTDGVVHAKTGSLSVSISLSGFIDNRYDRRRYYFAFLANRSGGIDQDLTRDAMDDMVAVLGVRGVPTAPRLLSVTNNGTGNSLTVRWADDGFVRTNFSVYGSSDATNFVRIARPGSNALSYVETGLVPGQKRFYRVSVMGNGGEGPPSRIYGAQADTNKSRLLLVDGFDRWQFQTDLNPSASNHAFTATLALSVSGPAFDTVHHGLIEAGTVPMTNYAATVWQTGEESTEEESFSAAEQALVQSYLAAGRHLCVTGSEIGWDLDRDTGPTTADHIFYRTQLRATLNGNANDDANTYSFAPVAGRLFEGNDAGGFDNGTGGTYNVVFPDVLTPTNGSVAILNYVGGRGGAAAVAYDGTSGGGKLVNFGFPFETITSAAARTAYMSDVLRFFDLLPAPRMLTTQQVGANLTLRWTGNLGLKYRVQYKTDLSQPAWQNLTPDVTATNTTVSLTDAPGTGTRFYRVMLVN